MRQSRRAAEGCSPRREPCGNAECWNSPEGAKEHRDSYQDTALAVSQCWRLDSPFGAASTKKRGAEAPLKKRQRRYLLHRLQRRKKSCPRAEERCLETSQHLV